MLIALTPETEARLRRKAEREGDDVNRVANALLTTVLQEEPAEQAEDVRETQEIDRRDRPFRQDPRLMGIQYHEDPIAPIEPEDWPEAFE